MLTAAEKQEIEKAISVMPVRKSGCIEALKVVQRHRRWISDESLKDVAAYSLSQACWPSHHSRLRQH
jgi:NADH-quinone oxidoreductase subunit E